MKLKKFKMDCNCDFRKLVRLTVLQSSFLLFVMIDMMLERHILLF